MSTAGEQGSSEKIINGREQQQSQEKEVLSGKTYDQVKISHDFEKNENINDDQSEKQETKVKQQAKQIKIFQKNSKDIQNPQNANTNSPYFSKPSSKLTSLTTNLSNQPTLALPSINISNKIKLNSSISYQQPLSSTLFKNKHLRYLFMTFCKQMYTDGGRWTFDDVAKNSEKMPVSKWMVFCKEFSLTQKLTKKQALDIFREATNFQPSMSYASFVRGIEIVKMRAKMDEKQLIQDVLHVSNHLDAREKLRNLKIHFNGPTANYLQECRYTHEQKAAVRPRKQYKRQIILHQGMSPQHLERQLKQRKEIREQKRQKRSALNNYSNNFSQVKHKAYTSMQRPNIKKKQRYFDSYKTIFKNTIEKDKLITQRTIESRSGIRKNANYSLLENSSLKDKKDSQVRSKSIQKSRRDFLTDDSGLSDNKYEKELAENKEILQVNEWMVDSDAESDEILKQHFTHEKNAKKQAIIKKKIETRLKSERQVSENDEQTQMMITQYH